jgi:hypothetical protein
MKDLTYCEFTIKRQKNQSSLCSDLDHDRLPRGNPQVTRKIKTVPSMYWIANPIR